MTARRGIVLWLVLSVTVVMAFLFFTFHMVVRDRNAQAHAVFFSEVAHGLAESGASLAWLHLRRELDKAGSSLRERLVQGSAKDLEGFELPIEVETEIEALTKDLGGDADLTVQATVLGARPLDGPADLSRSFDPLEKELEVEVRATGRFQALQREVLERRHLRIELDLLPVVSKFTLFVRQPEQESPMSNGYNVYANDIHGSPDVITGAAVRNYLPLVLFNHGDTLARVAHDLEKNGLVYLGGEGPVKLHLTSGADYRYGEIFHFYNFVGDDDARQPAFLADSPPEFFRGNYTVQGVEERYFLKHVIYGYFTVDRGDPPADMNRDGLLQLYFEPGSGGGAAAMRSSVLHLFGTPLAPSPTQVFGNVVQAYPVFSGVTVDVDHDGRRDGVVTLLPAVDEAGWSEKVADPGIPYGIKNIGNPGQRIPLDPTLLTYPRMFGDYAGYKDFMSALVEQEAYNWSIDYMRSKGEFPIRQTVLDRTKDYPASAEAVELRRQGQKGPEAVYYQGNLAEVGSALLASRAVVKVPDPASFLARFVRDGTRLVLGTQVEIEKGNLRLPEQLRVEKGGVILCRGSITFDGIETAAGERLSLVSIGGNIVSEFAHNSEDKPAQVDLIVLDGRVACLQKGHQLAIKGSLAVSRLLPVDFEGGGRVIYDPAGDPTAPERMRRARIYVSDRPESWRL